MIKAHLWCHKCWKTDQDHFMGNVMFIWTSDRKFHSKSCACNPRFPCVIPDAWFVCWVDLKLRGRQLQSLKWQVTDFEAVPEDWWSAFYARFNPWRLKIWFSKSSCCKLTPFADSSSSVGELGIGENWGVGKMHFEAAFKPLLTRLAFYISKSPLLPLLTQSSLSDEM